MLIEWDLDRCKDHLKYLGNLLYQELSYDDFRKNEECIKFLLNEVEILQNNKIDAKKLKNIHSMITYIHRMFSPQDYNNNEYSVALKIENKLLEILSYIEGPTQ
jgi:hypothetical protein